MKPEHPSRLSKEQIKASLILMAAMAPTLLGFTSVKANEPMQQPYCPNGTKWSEDCNSCVPMDNPGICPLGVPAVIPTNTWAPTEDPWHPNGEAESPLGWLSPEENGSEEGFPWGAIGLSTLALLASGIITFVFLAARHSDP
jgi:hypothetical protein